MRYRAICLNNGERTAHDIEACDAASAVAMVAQRFKLCSSFELLSFVPDATTHGWDAPHLAVGTTPAEF